MQMEATFDAAFDAWPLKAKVRCIAFAAHFPMVASGNLTWQEISASLSRAASISDFSTLVVPTSTGRPDLFMRFISVTTAFHLPVHVNMNVLAHANHPVTLKINAQIVSTVEPYAELEALLQHDSGLACIKSNAKLTHAQLMSHHKQSMIHTFFLAEDNI